MTAHGLAQAADAHCISMTPRTRAFLATVSPLALSAEGVLGGSVSNPWSVGFGIGSSTCLALASVASRSMGRLLAVLGIVFGLVCFRESLLASPLLALVMAVVATAVLRYVFRRSAKEPNRAAAPLGASLGTTSFFLGTVLLTHQGEVTARLLQGSLALSLFITFATMTTLGSRAETLRKRAAWLASAIVLLLTLLHVLPTDALLPAALALFLCGPVPQPSAEQRPWAFVTDHPERLLAFTFGGLCVIGTVLLSLPNASVRPLSLIDAAFTSVSAVCVTGLAVFDVGRELSLFGQWALLLLIQVGGLGIMTLSTLVYTSIGRRMSLRHELAVKALLGAEGRGALRLATARIVGFAFITELTGAAILTIDFASHGERIGAAAFRGLFTAVSAFCNAGFALQSDSLMGYADRPWVLHTVAALILLGGISPATVFAVPLLLKRTSRPPPIRHLIPLYATVILTLSGAAFMLALEWNGTFAEMGFFDRLNNAWLQAVTLRTAGFNSVDFAAMGSATLTLSLVFMFIGGNPGGTAGGIKTTTAALMLLGVIRTALGREATVVFKRGIAPESERRATVVFTTALFGALVFVMALQLTQSMPPHVAAFEVVSALGTVGLSIGGTALLDDVGKVIIIACMFIGRVGGLTLLMFLSSRRPVRSLERPLEQVDVG